jgi:hypothetical protein
VKLPVAVEKLAFPPKRPNLGIEYVSEKREHVVYTPSKKNLCGGSTNAFVECWLWRANQLNQQI